MKGASLFSSAGIAETYLKDIGIDIVVANELLEKRAKFHKHLYPDCEMIQGDITNDNIFNLIVNKCIENNTEFLLATPPCQGFSLIGKNKTEKDVLNDEKNYLIFKVFDLIDKIDFNYILIENVPRFIKTYFRYEDSYKTLLEILHLKYSDKYIIESDILNAKDYGVPQSRPRAIIKMYKKNLKWGWPEKEPEILLKDVLWDLPSLESGESSNIKWHSSKFHNERDILAMKHTPTGQSAFKNIVYYPKKTMGIKLVVFIILINEWIEIHLLQPEQLIVATLVHIIMFIQGENCLMEHIQMLGFWLYMNY